MKNIIKRSLIPFFILGIMCMGLGSADALASNADTRAVTPERTTRTIYIGSANAGNWARRDGSKTLTPNSYAQAYISNASNISNSNTLRVAALNGSGQPIQYGATFNSTGSTKTFFRNSLGRSTTFQISMMASQRSITGIRGTYYFYEVA